MATLHQHPARTNLSRAHHRRASPKKQRVVSAASVFKNRPKQTKKPTSVAKEAIAEAVRASVEAPALALVREPEVAVLQPASSSSPQKQVSKLKRTRSSEKHPLVVVFKDTTAAYRTHLYESAVLKINAAHASLVKRLYDSNYRSGPAMSPSNPSATTKLSLADRIRQETHYLHPPLGTTRLTLRETQADGSQVPFDTTLGERMSAFITYVRDEKAAIEKLQSRWELIVGEIWKSGTVILGEEGMRVFLAPLHSPTDDVDGDGEGEDEVEDTLFIPDDTSTPFPVSKAKKKVAFKDPLPAFLTQKSRMKQLDPMPELPQDRVIELERAISELGAKEVERLKSLEVEQEKWWKKKVQQLEQVWAAD